MTPETATALRQPFPDALVGKLPRITCPDCRKAPSKNCKTHSKKRCNDCGNWITEKHLHLDYVGHAETTDRLLSVDPEWTWEPMAFDADGLPKFDASGGLWIRLTIDGTTRLGYGDAGDKRGPDATKEIIGDALRNAAMRFGVALDLWAKSELAPAEPEPPAETTPVLTDPSTWPDIVPASLAKSVIVNAFAGDKTAAKAWWDEHGKDPMPSADLAEAVAGIGAS